MRQNNEEKLQIAVATYIKLQYPDVIFTAEGSGVNKSKAQAGKTKAMRSSGKLPDLWILEPKGKYHGLIVELKAKNIRLQSGEISKSAHVQGQLRILERLSAKKYKACFGIGFDNCRAIIDDYMRL